RLVGQRLTGAVVDETEADRGGAGIRGNAEELVRPGGRPTGIGNRRRSGRRFVLDLALEVRALGKSAGDLKTDLSDPAERAGLERLLELAHAGRGGDRGKRRLDRRR